MDKNLNLSKAARRAAVLYLLLVAIASYGMGYVPTKIFVPRDVAATSQKILSNEFLFRSGILSHLMSTTAIVIMVLMLYKLLRPVNNHLARLMVVPVLLQGAIVIILECFNIASLTILKEEALIGVDKALREQAAYFLLRMHSVGIGLSQFFWGLWLIPFAMLINRSGYAPRLFAWLLFINGAGYIVEAAVYILLQRNEYLNVRTYARLSFIGLPLTMLWFLIRGISKNKVHPNDIGGRPFHREAICS